MPKEPQRVSIIISAYNEGSASDHRGEYLRRTMAAAKEAQRQGLVQNVIVVDDGSTDDTATIARAEIAAVNDAEVITLRKNYGKGRAFIVGLQRCKKLGATQFVTLDADLEIIDASHIRGLLAELNRPIVGPDWKEKPCNMVISEYHERSRDGNVGVEPSIDESGIRAFRMNAFDFLFERPMKRLAREFVNVSRGFGLTPALNMHFRDNTKIYRPPKPIVGRSALGGAVARKDFMLQDRQHQRAGRLMERYKWSKKFRLEA